MREVLTAVTAIRPGDRVYDNRHPDWLWRWPRVVRVDALARGRAGLHTVGLDGRPARFFARAATETVLVRDMGGEA